MFQNYLPNKTEQRSNKKNYIKMLYILILSTQKDFRQIKSIFPFIYWLKEKKIVYITKLPI